MCRFESLNLYVALTYALMQRLGCTLAAMRSLYLHTIIIKTTLSRSRGCGMGYSSSCIRAMIYSWSSENGQVEDSQYYSTFRQRRSISPTPVRQTRYPGAPSDFVQVDRFIARGVMSSPPSAKPSNTRELSLRVAHPFH